jgi:DNA-binding response OmpR family regulator
VPHKLHNYHQQPTTVVAVLGTNSVVNSALALLLKSAGYDIRRIERDMPGLANGLLEGVDLLLLAPGLSNGPREGVLSVVRDNPTTAQMPVLTLSSAIGEALGNEGGQVVVAWPIPIEELVRRIETVLAPATGEEA